MKLITRAQLGWPPSAAPTQATTKGVKVHYEGAPVSTRLLADHSACIAEWKAIRASHLANTAENYSDVAYNFAACPHGFLLEGRGIGRRTGANGNQDLNRGHYAIVGLVGSTGLTQPTDAMLHAIRDGIELLRRNGAGSEIKGHRDGYATACPGGPLYAWVQKGAPRPTTSPTPAPKPTPPKEEDMTPEQASQLKKVHDERAVSPWTYKGTGEKLDAYAYLRGTSADVKTLASKVAQLTEKVDGLDETAVDLTPEDITALGDQLASSPVLAEAIAERVAEKLAARLAE